jgi:MATE family multidrug resistance protein
MLILSSYLQYIKELFKLALPMIMGSLGIILIGAGDVFVAAKYSTNTLAAISIANSILTCIFLFGIGLLTSISPLLSNFRGSKNNIKKYFVPTINFAMILAFLSSILILLFIPLICNLGFEAFLIPSIKKYMFICAFSTFGAYLQMGLKEYLQAFEIVIFPNFLNILSVIIHLFLDFVFVFGWCGFPEMGAVGLAIATLLSRSLFGLILFLYCLKIIKIRPYKDLTYFTNLLKIGFPIASAMLLEILAFNLITILIGRVSGVYAAGQNILLTLSTATFMIPLAISNAIAIKVGFANGACNYEDVKKYSVSGIGISVFFMFICALAFIFFPNFFITIFTQDIALIKICVPILILMGFFQVFDGLQVSLGGVFKGLKKTNIVMLGNLFAYWIVGLPLGLLLAYKYNMNLYGFWIGITVSIFSLGIILLLIILREFNLIKRVD